MLYNIDYIPYVAPNIPVIVLKLLICTSSSFHLFHPAPQPSSPLFSLFVEFTITSITISTSGYLAPTTSETRLGSAEEELDWASAKPMSLSSPALRTVVVLARVLKVILIWKSSQRKPYCSKTKKCSRTKMFIVLFQVLVPSKKVHRVPLWGLFELGLSDQALPKSSMPMTYNWSWS